MITAQQAAGQSQHGVGGELRETGVVVGRHREERAGSEDGRVDAAGDAGRHHQRDEGPGGELEQQQLDGQHHRRQRRAEGGRHAGRGAAGQQDLPLEGETSSTWPSSEPIAPPVTMIGPSAPNGPPVPMAMAADSGLAIAVRGAMRLCWLRIASIASGMPWPRMIGDQLASSVTAVAPQPPR